MDEFEEQITKAERDLQEVLIRMEEIKQDFVKEAVGTVKEWYMSSAGSEVQSQTNVTDTLSGDELSEMKAAVRTLQEKAERAVSACLDEDALWWHRTRGEQDYYAELHRPPEELRKALLPAEEKLSPLLREFGYATQSTGHVRWSESMVALMKEYQTLKSDAEMKEGEINQLVRDKEMNEARDRWRKA